jgi:hypothetical protein
MIEWPWKNMVLERRGIWRINQKVLRFNRLSCKNVLAPKSGEGTGIQVDFPQCPPFSV